MVHEEGRIDPNTSPLAPSPVSATGDASPPKPKQSSGLRELIETLLLAALIFFVVRLLVLNFRVDGESMTPNLQNDEYLLVNVNSYRHFELGGNEFWPFGGPKRGDIIILNPTPDAEQPYIKRIIGLPGEHVTFHQGYVYINGQPLDETYIEPGITRCRDGQYCDVMVEPDHVFVLGDNRTNSTDSRYIGQIPVDQVIGKAWVSYWPLNLFGFVPHYEYPPLPATDQPIVTPTAGSTGTSGQPANGGAASPPARAKTDETKQERRARRQSEKATEAAGGTIEKTPVMNAVAPSTPTP